MSERPAGAPVSRLLAQGEGWSVSEVVCHLGPHDPRFEEQHELVSIAAVVEGSFQYRSDHGKALLYPGSFFLGNAGTCFECGHDHGTGDRCIAFQFAPAFFEEIAASAAGSHRFRFPTGMLPATSELIRPVVEAETGAKGASPLALDELAVWVAEKVIATLAGTGAPSGCPSARDERRISAVLRYIEEHAEEPLDLPHLAQVALMSKYHFLRTFRHIAGVTPYQFLLGIRMRRAAVMLRTTPMPVAAIAYDAGFGDLSTFNGRFREMFGSTPSIFRGTRP